MTKNKHLKAKINKLYIYTKTPVPKTHFFGIFLSLPEVITELKQIYTLF